MVIMAREMLKLRKGDQALCIKNDGKVELAGIEGKPLIDEQGNMQPVILFAAAWARKTDSKVMGVLFENFKQAVREGYFGFDAKKDFAAMESAAASGAVTTQSASGAVTTESPQQGGMKFKETQTEEEYKKQKEEEKRLEAFAKNADPRVKKQQEALAKGAKVISIEPFEKHRLPDLPVEQTMAYKDASPEEKVKMKEAYSQTDISDEAEASEPIVGNVTIEEEIGNENK